MVSAHRHIHCQHHPHTFNYLGITLVLEDLITQEVYMYYLDHSLSGQWEWGTRGHSQALP